MSPVTRATAGAGHLASSVHTYSPTDSGFPLASVPVLRNTTMN